MTYATKRYADGSQRDPQWRLRHGLFHNPKANFHFPRASIKSRERSEFKSTVVRQAIARGVVLAMKRDSESDKK